jgi:hypothetical protein
VRALEQATTRAADNEEDEELPTAMELALRQALEGSGISMPLRQSKNKRRTKKNKRMAEHEEIFARTVQQHIKE